MEEGVDEGEGAADQEVVRLVRAAVEVGEDVGHGQRGRDGGKAVRRMADVRGGQGQGVLEDELVEVLGPLSAAALRQQLQAQGGGG